MFDTEEYMFFNPSPNYREMMILKIISKNSDTSQESLAKKVGIVPSMVNRYLKDFEDKDLIIKSGENRRRMSYQLTKNGQKRLQFLMVSYINEVSKLYTDTRDSFEELIKALKKHNLKNIFLYGAGVVGTIVLKVLNIEDINVLGFIDDSISKQGDKIHGIDILNPKEVDQFDYDAIIIASFRHSEEIKENALKEKLKNLFIFKIDENGNVSLNEEEII
ncbi:winged helix-turn-helix transcriptional regulator [Oceanotoga sp. DSM 15011]|jgi:DNA-binding MarR family transcriptional regulator|uniref:C-methyltransferase-like protein n=1 Tax=Oceanotoga teriensis TaxID=515440 RepID=A0AA45HJ82_9BACT|nr:MULTISPECIES: winged helix-turn-helix transcriptional regulator [Oceanotoga]MDN5343208.1 hypothetical protein [Oceanotoga sp.]MDO7976278.1 winged helix-turn-helix transcriptional regulator [Oceanotoga teriensis]PWJ95475.1 C-methyltransferase-like protein [Oceanotoga teriensis]UYP01114.1 winged helix-turn-helix transcriptional regulator [Oceanotoga sp. DSM 15011]